MKQKFICEVCLESFDSNEECLQHEILCKGQTFQCDKCGKVETWRHVDVNSLEKQNSCHAISLGYAEHGSYFDGCYIKFNLCDDCLRALIESFTLEGQEKVFNSGANHRMSTEDWLREARGELSDMDYEERGMYSPRQIKAYKERFPVCKRVSIYQYSTGHCGSRCLRPDFAISFGDGEGKATDLSTHCYECTYFIQRAENEEIKIVQIEALGKDE